MVAGEEENVEEEGDLSLRRRCLRWVRSGFARREVGVALILCFSREGGICVRLLSLLRGCFHVVEIGRVLSIHNIRRVSTMTTADSAVRIS